MICKTPRMNRPGRLVLCIDTGNTRTKVQLRRVFGDGSSIAKSEEQALPTFKTPRMLFDPNRDLREQANEFVMECENRRVQFERSFSKILSKFDRNIPVAICSVVPETTAKLQELCAGRGVVEINTGMYTAIQRVPPGLGVDLLAACMSAYMDHNEPARAPRIVLGLGTASTICTITAPGMLEAVNFTAGLQLMMDAVFKGCALISDANSGDVYRDQLGGSTTEECLRNGTFTTFLDGLRGWIERTKETFARTHDKPALVIATGGWSQLAAEHIPAIEVVDPELTMKGIARLALTVL